MEITMVPVDKKDKEILRNLLEKYDYEFSQYDGRDVNQYGLYGYDYLDHYWTEPSRHAFFVKAGGNLAGFVMVNRFTETKEETDYSMSEFFIMYKYRRSGIGRHAAMQVFGMFRGRWQVKYHPGNTGSGLFWVNVVNDFTKGDYRLEKAYPGTEYDDGTPGDILFFRT
ncbi:MAG: GNAT family N-acetyltransferase [Clostridia bacterium]